MLRGHEPPVFFIHPQWAVLNDIHVNHQQYLDANGGHRIANDESDHHSIKTDRIAAGGGRWDLLPGLRRPEKEQT